MPARKLALSLLVCLAAVLAIAMPAAAATYPSGFEERTVVSGLTIPTAVAWTPDGRAIVVEKSGLVKLALPGETTPTTVLDLRERVNDNHDRGLLGVAVDGQFATNPYVYLLYTYDINQVAPDGGGPMVSQLLRVRLTGDNRMVDEQVILGTRTTGECPAASNAVDCIPSDYDSHSIGTVLSAPDGTLYAGSGDASSYNWADVRALRSLDERSLAGKIVHIDREGRGLPGHASCPSNTNLSDVCTKVYARGFRNPFRFTLRPDGKGLVVGDVGWNTYEEVELVGQGGRSYGWPCYEGSGKTAGYRDMDACKAEYAKPAGTHTPPDHAYCHCGSGASVVGGPLYDGDGYPSSYRGSIFVGDYSQRWIKRLELDANGAVTAVKSFAGDWGGVQLASTPTGDLAFPDFGDFTDGSGSIKAVRYVAGNRAPAAHVTADRTSGSAPLTVKLDASGSTDADGDAMTYAWTFGDGTTGTGAAPTHTYAQPGTYTAAVTVRDELGATDVASVVITAGNDAPVAQITSPADRSLFRGGAAVALTGAGTDPQDGNLPSSALSWRIVLHHNDHNHPLTDLAGASTSFVAREDHDADSYYEITLTVKDSGGLTGSRTIRVDPATVGLNLASQPAGAVMTWAGLDHTAPYAATTAVGFRTEVAAAPTLVSGGRTLDFARWSDGVTSRTRTLTVGESAVSLTAIYEEPATVTPVLAYAFDTDPGTVAKDLSGKGNDGTISGARWTAAGRYGGALTFDGVNDWVTVTDRAALDLGAAYTLSAWVKPESANRWQTVLMKEAAPDAFGYALYGTSDSPAPSAWAGLTSLYGPGALPRSTWSNLTVTVGGGVQRLYVDGVQVASGPATGGTPTDQPLRIGGNALWSSEFFKGAIDEVRVYDRTLTAEQVRADRDRGAGGGAEPPPPEPPTGPTAAWGFDETSGTVARDATGNGNDGALSGATWAAGRYGGGVSFDGVNDWVTVADDADLDLTSPYTLEAWVNPRTRTRWSTILLKELGSTLSYGLYANSDFDAPSAWTGEQSAYGTSPLGLGTWTHVAVSVGGGSQRLYVDGTLVDTKPASFAVESAGPLRMGGNAVWGEYFNGTLDEVRVYQRALTAAEIATDRVTPITTGTQPDTGPVASYAFDAGSGATAADATGHGHTGAVEGAAWVAAGRHGGALRFDGVNDWVSVDDHADLDLTGRWSLSAWVRPESATGWQTAILKEAYPSLAYALYARTSAGPPSGDTDLNTVRGTAALPTQTWSHLTATFDDGTMRLYRDGVLQATTTGAATPQTSDGPLRIGGNGVWGEYFTGAIDDVRVYARALSAAEVQADMDAPVTGTAGGATATAATARAASRTPVRSRTLTVAQKRAVARKVRRAAADRRAAARQHAMTRRQKAASIRRALKRIAARRAAARRKAGLPPLPTRAQKAHPRSRQQARRPASRRRR